MSGRKKNELGPRGGSLNPAGRGGKRAAQSKAAAAARIKRIVKGRSPFDLLDGRGAAGHGAALPEAVIAGLGLLPSPWLVRSSGTRAAASAESLRSACAALRESARAADSLHASSSAAPALATSSHGESGRVSHRGDRRQLPAACAADDVPPPSTVTAAAAQVTAAAESSAKRSRAALQRDAPSASHRGATPTRTAATGNSAPATAAAVAARAASRARRVERTDPAARLALSLVIMGAVLFSGLAARARFAAIDSPTLRVDTGLRLPTGSAADAASPCNMELDGGVLQFRAGGARAVAAAAAEAEARRLSAATGDVHEAVSVVAINGTESQSGIQSLLPASVPDLPDWQRTRGWMDQSRALAAAAFTVAFGAGENAAARAAVDAAMHGRCLLSALPLVVMGHTVSLRAVGHCPGVPPVGLSAMDWGSHSSGTAA